MAASEKPLPATAGAGGDPATGDDRGGDLRSRIVEVLKTVYDPEIPVDIYELGLIYDIKCEDSGMVTITMTLTSPACPVAGSLLIEVESRVRCVPGVMDVEVKLTWDPPWHHGLMSEAAQLQLGFF